MNSLRNGTGNYFGQNRELMRDNRELIRDNRELTKNDPLAATQRLVPSRRLGVGSDFKEGFHAAHGDRRSTNLLAEFERWVTIETPTTDAARVNALMDFVVGGLAEAGVSLTRIPGRDGYGDNLIARVDHTSGVKPILVVGHLDTVWSTGALAKCLSISTGIALTVPASWI